MFLYIFFILVGLYIADQFQSAGLSVFTNNWFSVHNFTPEVEDSWSLIRKVHVISLFSPLPLNSGALFPMYSFFSIPL